MPPSRQRRVVFTLNNYTQDEIVELSTRLADESQVVYAIFGREVAPETGTPHLQGYVKFKNPKTFTAIRTYISLRARVDTAKGSCAQNQKYCSKEGDFEEFGTLPDPDSVKKGLRSDLTELRSVIESGERSLANLRRLYPDLLAKYDKFVQSVLDDTKENIPPAILHPLRPWQQQLHDDLAREPDERKIIFVVDEVGNSGKTWFANYYEFLHGNKVCILEPSKKDDMAMMLPHEPPPRVVILDCARASTEFLQYGFLEAVKNGRISSPKFYSFMKRIPTPHVVVFINAQPDMSKLSLDRYDIRVVGPDMPAVAAPLAPVEPNAGLAPGFNPGPGRVIN